MFTQGFKIIVVLAILGLTGCGKTGGGLSSGNGGGSVASSSAGGAAALSISPSALAIGVANTQTFSASGGNAPYTFSVVSGSGSINSSSGLYTAPTAAGSAVVQVSDASGVTVQASVTISVLMQLSPAPLLTVVNKLTTFTATLGYPPYVYSMSGVGSINSSTGVYTAPAGAGSAVITVTDAINEVRSTTVTINTPVAISPTTKTIVANNSFTFSASAGVPPYTYSVTSGGGTVGSSSGTYTAPAAAGSAVVRVTDALGDFSSSNITINAALAISPTSKTLAVNNAATFTASGGISPYTYSKVTGGGSITAGGVYTAPATSGTATVRVTDSDGNTSNAAITINPALAISPSSKTVAVNNTISFSATGGVSGYTYSRVSGTGTVTAGGAYTAPAAAGTDVIRVTDSLGNTSDSTITINAALAISPTSATLAVNNSTTFSATGGVGSYTYSIPSGGGSINSTTGVYTAPSSAGSATVRVTDALGNTSNATVTINAPLAISPTSKTVAVNTTATFTASGGVSPYTYSNPSGGLSINSTTGVYTAPSSAGSATVTVTDSLSNTSSATITVVTGVVISPSTLILAVNDISTFSASGGVSPYTYSVFAGTGTINASTGVYTAPAAAGSATIRVTDSIGSTNDASVTINAALAIVPTTKTLAVNNTFTFSTTGGVSPFTYSITVGGGSINSTSGAYTAPSSSGTATVQVADSLGHTRTAAVTINPALTISPSMITLAVNDVSTFSTTGGVGAITYSVPSGGGSINSSTGVYTAPAASGSSVVRATDSLGNTSDSTVTINPALAISPSTLTLAVNNTSTFSASGGVSPYTYTTNSGVINAATGFFTAPSSAGSATITVTDTLGNTSTSTVTINAALAISPASKSLAVNNVFSFSATGGVSPYTYTMVSGGGSINSSTGSYTAPATAGSATVTVTDSYGNASQASITINPALAITPTTATIAVNNIVTLSGSGGVAPYTYTVPSGGGSVSATGSYTAPAASGSATVRVTDSLGNTANAAITINPALAISPTTATVAVGNSKTFSATGGVTTYTYSVTGTSGASINSSSGVYTAGSTSGTDTVTVTDSVGNTSTATVTVNPALTISPATQIAIIGQSYTFSATGGVGAYTYSVSTGTGTLAAAVYTAPAAPATETVRVTDSIGNTSDSTVTVIQPTKVVAGGNHSCAMFSNGSVKCWGLNTSGQLGLGNTTAHGNAANTMGSNLAFVNLGTTKTATDIVAGGFFTCALLNDSSVKCWGDNQYGQLGQGNTTNYGSAANQMGDSLAAINLGTDKTATAIAAGQYHACAILNDSTLKCWGLNSSGQLGLSNTTNAGASAATMGDSLATITLGAGLSPLSITAGISHTCAILTGNVLKCWGLNGNGQLGQGNTTNYGSAGGGTSVNNMSNISLGTGKTAVAISGGTNISCAILNDAGVKCWGANGFGQLGQGNTTTVGTGGGQMGNNLAEVSLGGGKTATAITTGNRHTCVILNDSTVKCWGLNTFGQDGQGTNTPNYGSGAGQMGNSLAALSLGTGRTALGVGAGPASDHTCALLDNHTVKCWGYNANGELGLGDVANHGDAAGEMGNSLSALVF